jgi:hypothetical protein
MLTRSRQDPAQYADTRGSRKTRQAGKADIRNQEGIPNEDIKVDQDRNQYDYEDSSDSDESDLGLHDADNHDEFADEEMENQNGENGSVPNGSSQSKNLINQIKNYKENKKGLHRKQRGLMQWKPMRNLAFAKDEAKFAVRRTMNKASLGGRQPDVETET